MGAFNSMDGQGASLVVIYNPPFLEWPPTARIIRLRHGAMTLNSVGPAMSHTFSGLSVPKTPLSAELHVGIGDGELSWEDSMRLAGVPITGQGFFSGANGPQWDDATIGVPASLLPAGTTSVTNSISLLQNSAPDCLAWAYSALSYKWQTSAPIL